MKKLLCVILTLCLMLMAFAGCGTQEPDLSKDDGENNTIVETTSEETKEAEEVQLVGVWKAKVEAVNVKTGEVDISTTQTLEFKEDGTVVQTSTREEYVKLRADGLMGGTGAKTEEELDVKVKELFGKTFEELIESEWPSSEAVRETAAGTWKMDDTGKITWNSVMDLTGNGNYVVLVCDGLESGKPIQFVYNYEDEGTLTYTLTK